MKQIVILFKELMGVGFQLMISEFFNIGAKKDESIS